MELYAVVGYTEFYKRDPPGGFEIVLEYPTDALMLQLCKINATLFQRTEPFEQIQIGIIKEFFSHLDQEKGERMVSFFQEWSREKAEEEKFPVYFNEQAIVHLISFILGNYRHETDDGLINVQKLENDLFDAILLANDIYYNKRFVDFDLLKIEAIWQLSLAQQFYLRDYEQLHIAPVKFLIFHKFIKERFENGVEIISEFTNAMGLKNFWQYASIFLNIVSNVFRKSNSSEIKWHLDPNDPNIGIIETFSLRPKDLMNSDKDRRTHAHLVPRPFYFIRDRYPAVIDFNFLGFLMNTAVIYNFYHHSSLNGSAEFKTFNAFQGFLGKAFYENYLAGNLFKALFASRGNMLYADTDKSGFPDFVIKARERDLFIIEVKSTSVHYNVLEELNVEKFRMYLNDNYLQKKGSGKKNKGVYQLIGFLNKLASSTELDYVITTEKRERSVIYPIIVYTDRALDISGVNRFCTIEFDKALSECRQKFRHVYPLTMINIDFFIHYYDKLKRDTSFLKTMIIGYHKRAGSSLKYFKNNKDNAYVFLKANISFTQYVKEKEAGHKFSVRSIANDFFLEQE